MIIQVLFVTAVICLSFTSKANAENTNSFSDCRFRIPDGPFEFDGTGHVRVAGKSIERWDEKTGVLKYKDDLGNPVEVDFYRNGSGQVTSVQEVFIRTSPIDADLVTKSSVTYTFLSDPKSPSSCVLQHATQLDSGTKKSSGANQPKVYVNDVQFDLGNCKKLIDLEVLHPSLPACEGLLFSESSNKAYDLSPNVNHDDSRPRGYSNLIKAGIKPTINNFAPGTSKWIKFSDCTQYDSEYVQLKSIAGSQCESSYIDYVKEYFKLHPNVRPSDFIYKGAKSTTQKAQ